MHFMDLIIVLHSYLLELFFFSLSARYFLSKCVMFDRDDNNRENKNIYIKVELKYTIEGVRSKCNSYYFSFILLLIFPIFFQPNKTLLYIYTTRRIRLKTSIFKSL